MSLPNASSGRPRAQIESLIGARRYPEALRLIATLEAEHPGNRDLLYARAYCLAAMGNMEDARQAAQTLGVIYGDPRGAQLLAQIDATRDSAPSTSRKAQPWKKISAVVAGIALVVLLAYPLLTTRIPAVAPAEGLDEFAEARSVVERWTSAFESGEVDSIVAMLTEDFQLYRVGDREAVRATLMQAASTGLLNGTRFDFEWTDGGVDVKTDFSRRGEKIIAGPLRMQSPILVSFEGADMSYVKLELVQRDEQFQISAMHTHKTDWDF